jgi:hypothetical protein
MQNALVHTAAAALLAVALAPAAFAQSATRADPNPYATAGKAPVCTQLELNAGIRGDDCGQLTLSELALIKSKKDNTN